jgi:hypothetical protein
MTAKQRLATALTDAGAPDSMVQDALMGRYDDFESESATPIIDLVRACTRIGLVDIAERAKDGEFDAE